MIKSTPAGGRLEEGSGNDKTPETMRSRAFCVDANVPRVRAAVERLELVEEGCGASRGASCTAAGVGRLVERDANIARLHPLGVAIGEAEVAAANMGVGHHGVVRVAFHTVGRCTVGAGAGCILVPVTNEAVVFPGAPRRCDANPPA